MTAAQGATRTTSHGATRSQPHGAGREGGLRRRVVAVVIAAEAVAAAVVIGVARHDAFGWTLAALFVLAVPVLLLASRAVGRHADEVRREPVSRVRVTTATSRSSGEVGVLVDEQGYAASLEVSLARNATLDLGAVVADLADDPSRLSAVQLRITSYSPSGTQPEQLGGRRRGQYVPVHRRAHLVLRFEPARARDVVQSRGGGSGGSRAALVAALDRAALRLRRDGIVNRVADAATLETLLGEDTRADVPTRLFAVDFAQGGDIQRLLDVVALHRPQRSVVSLCVEFAAADRWRSTGSVQITGDDERALDAVTATLRADDAVVGVAAPSDITRVLPLGGGPGDLAAVVTLERT
ncbi:type VII secretion protein EccE [uncultured Jatrophihabitans sp.]|uniref:type VII secretion protein EccE n=1 Tax=uncultured Jatrophihabitans sp. TaxID=1610747 RepID=UPI0035CC1431